ncbi:TIGR02234 family membrane protein [Mycobacterium sp.]|uniref:TIGR02234 family membrane protein n=1 Tax=Mycobacterium sp. TaxID=1785 RepID=UPI002D63C9D0|nr:TIGR02234 family membrane protein [Mycobacterium sp.]HZA12528.1 TIGR02234 family membrane protein [Mycobacterium sp.]
MTIRLAQLLLVVAGAALWVASRLPWVVIRTFAGLGQPQTVTLSGASWSTALVPLAVLLLAAAVAALAVRGWLLRLLAVLVGLASGGMAYLAITLWVLHDVAVRAAWLTDVPVASLVGSERHYAGAVLTLAAAVCVLLAAVLLMRAAVKGRAVRYASPGERRAAAIRADSRGTMSERMMWDAIDVGSDPTRESNTEGR